MSKRVTVAMAMVGIGVGLILGPLLAGPADAQYTTFPPSQSVPTIIGNENIYITGLDGAIWYTSVDPGGANGNVTTGNSSSPFDIAAEDGCPLACTGFVQVSGANGLLAACATTGDTCVNIWVMFPGAGTFTSGPQAFDNSPFCTNSHNIMATGTNNAPWWTVFDAHQSGTATAMDTSCPPGNPFHNAGEDQNSTSVIGGGTGFVNQSLFNTACTFPNICVGIYKSL